ncbi:hypothetical protein J2738_003281 [Variovorax paradoxus]|uniref:Uncharacterized protein n=1 Tax=Variovorax paradoxus TaxID=34073 RepID=A0AAE4BXU3_VARPD|nr:hypothetical protein [Variovorax paradoxus]MDR6427143.1 hypothetical protein [Variovorax paradoxus]
MSTFARNFLRLRFWLEGLDGAEHRSLSPYEQRMGDRLRSEAAWLIEAAL